VTARVLPFRRPDHRPEPKLAPEPEPTVPLAAQAAAHLHAAAVLGWLAWLSLWSPRR
jgi:hypothetical protein